MNTYVIKESIKSEFEDSRKEFHSLLDSLSIDDLKKQSHNPGWTNGEILFHMIFGFIILYPLVPLVRIFGKLPNNFSKLFSGILDLSTPLFNTINAFGAKGGGKIFAGKERLGKRFDSIIVSLLKILYSVNDDEWNKGMYYPQKWDSLFDEYMTIEKLFHYPVRHFKFHLKQIKK